MERVSAIIPAYNGVARYIEHAVRSVLAQTYRDVELIVVDDASTDETAQLVLSFPRARYVRLASNRGQAAARNQGATLATGRFLAFLDQDDLWESGFLQTVVTAADAHADAALIHSDGYQVDEHERILTYDAAMKHTASITQMLRGGHDTATSGSLIRKTCFDAVGRYDEQLTIWEDIDLAIRLYQRFPVLHLPTPLYHHRLYGHNASRDIPSGRALSGRWRFLVKHAPACKPGTPEARALSRDWAHYYGDLGKHHWREGRRDEARRAFWRSMKYGPFHHKAILRLVGAYLPGRVATIPSND